IDALTRQGKVVDGSSARFARSMIGAAVAKGAPKPDISSAEAFKRALLAAKSVAYSDAAGGGASGVFLAKAFDKLGIAAALKANRCASTPTILRTRICANSSDARKPRARSCASRAPTGSLKWARLAKS